MVESDGMGHILMDGLEIAPPAGRKVYVCLDKFKQGGSVVFKGGRKVLFVALINSIRSKMMLEELPTLFNEEQRIACTR